MNDNEKPIETEIIFNNVLEATSDDRGTTVELYLPLKFRHHRNRDEAEILDGVRDEISSALYTLTELIEHLAEQLNQGSTAKYGEAIALLAKLSGAFVESSERIRTHERKDVLHSEIIE